MTRIQFNTETLSLHPSGALLWPRLRLIAIADLHFEKSSAAARGGRLAPPFDSTETLARLAALIAEYTPQTLVSVGDAFHDPSAATRLSPANRQTLAHISAQTSLIWVQGNHDPTPNTCLPGTSTHEYTAEGIIFRHEAINGAPREISGHFHPKARIATRATTITRPCFLSSAEKIILPAFGTYTGGLDIHHPAIARHFPSGAEAHLLGNNRLFHFTLEKLVPAPAPHR